MGSSFDFGSGPWVLSLDLEASLQRQAAHGAALGPWGPALGSYGYLSYALRRGCELRLETETGSSSGLTTSTSEKWTYRSLNLALRWALL